MAGKNFQITAKCVAAYWTQYPDGDGCGYEIPDGGFVVYSKDKKYDAPEAETEEVFLDRLKRSKAAGRNLFFEEWEEDTEEYGPNVDL